MIKEVILFGQIRSWLYDITNSCMQYERVFMRCSSDKNKSSMIIRIMDILRYPNIPFVILFISMLYVHILHSMMPGDDFWFHEVSRTYSLIDYLKLRYMNWTGRISAEVGFYYIFMDDAFLWKFINPLFVTLTSYSISRIILGKKDYKERYMINWYICIGIFLLSKHVILNSIMWITGSIVYLWMVLAALLAFIPFADALDKNYSKKFNILYIFCGIFAALGEEQVALVLLAFVTITNIYIYIRDKKLYKYLILENFFILVGSVILFIAPGNTARNRDEIINWLPNYPLYSIWEIGFYGFQWFLNLLLNDSKIIFFLVLLVLSISLYKKSRGFKNKLSIIIPMAGCILIFCSIIFSLDIFISDLIKKKIEFPYIYHEIWNNFSSFNVPENPYAVNNTVNLDKLTAIKFIVWTIIIFTVPYFIVQLYNFSIRGIYISLAYIAGICSVIIMFVSPTIYASGERTFFVLAIMFLIVFISMLKKSEVLLKGRYLFIFIIFAVIKYIYVFL